MGRVSMLICSRLAEMKRTRIGVTTKPEYRSPEMPECWSNGVLE
jgi:hypothetical protein